MLQDFAETDMQIRLRIKTHNKQLLRIRLCQLIARIVRIVRTFNFNVK